MTVLLTWNPGPDDTWVFDRRTWLTDVVAPCVAGLAVPSSWGVGRHRNGIGPGTEVLLHRQGSRGRGIVARGEVTSEVLTGVRPRRPDRPTNYVELVWTEAVPVELRIDIRELEEVVPDFGWRTVYSSGRTLPEPVATALREEWQALVEDPVTRRTTAEMLATEG